jgi:adhesin transport system membrane fusion protein
MRVQIAARGFSALLRVNNPSFAVISARALGAFFLLAALALGFVPWQQTSEGTGRVIAYSPVEREQTIKAPMSGLIANWYVQEGTRVSAGDLIVELADNDPNILQRLKQERDATTGSLKAARVSVEAHQAQLEALREARGLTIAAADARVRQAANKIQAARQKLAAARAALKAAELNAARKRELSAKGLASDRERELAEMSRAKSQAAVFSAQADLAAAQGELLAKKADRLKKAAEADAKLAKERAALEKSRGELAKATGELAKAEVKLSRQSRMKVTAPRAGTIARVLVKQGSEFVKAADPLALLVPDTARRAVTVWVDGNDVPLIHPGRQVRLQFEGWPAVQFSGWPSVAVGTFGGEVGFVDATADADGRFRVVVVSGEHEWPEARYLRQGARANAWILLNQVSLGYEVWRQLNGFPPSQTRPPDATDPPNGEGKGKTK